MKIITTALFTALATSLLAACGNGGDSATISSGPQTVTIAFDAIANGSSARCGTTLTSLGSTGVSANLRDLRFYVSNVALIDASGNAAPLSFTTNAWQNASVALLSFIDGSGATCGGQPLATNTSITGTVAAGSYVGLQFEVGVPESVNHTDYAAATAPLDVSAMAWSWQIGRKFVKIEVDPVGGITKTAGGTGAIWYLHLGSTGCSASSSSSAGFVCTNSNRAPVKLASFDAARQKVVLDLTALYTGANLALDQGGAPGCMSEPTDADCTAPFANLKIDLATGAPLSGGSSSQRVFIAASK